MTPPMTPREKVAALKTNDPTNPAHRLARDLQAGRFASLEQRDDLIEVLSNLPRYAALASGSGDHAELARLSDYCRTLVNPGDLIVGPNMMRHALEQSAGALEILLAENAALRAACAKSNDEICQTLGKALGYPWFKDDQVNFPGAADENGVCVGDHVAESLADEAARRIAEAERKLAESGNLNDRAADLMRQCTDPERFEGASSLNVYANMRVWLSDLSKEAERG